tara:strand:+ start:2045 stop:3718 length:1674 start_codon:yes stop_codon:yes gene_type:complete
MGEKDSLWVLVNGWSFQYTKGNTPFSDNRGQLLQPNGEPFFEFESKLNINLMFSSLMVDAEEKIVDELVRRKALGQDVEERTAFFGGRSGYSAIYENKDGKPWFNNVFDPDVVVDVKGPPPPVIIDEVYSIAGRVGEKETEVPLENVKVSYTNTTSSIIEGLRTPGDPENSNQGIPAEVFTDIEGNYSFDIRLAVDGNTGKVVDEKGTSTTIFFDLEGYSQARKGSILAGDRTPLSSLPIQLLKPRNQDLREEQTKMGSVGTKEVKKIKKQVPKDPKAILIKKIMEMVKKIGDKIIPLLLAMLYEFGLSKIEEGLAAGKNMLEDAKCVPNPRLLQMIRLKNKLTRQLNNIYRIIDRAIKFVGIAAGLLSAFRIVVRVLRFLPIPAAFLNLALINKIQAILEKISKLIGQFTQITVGILAALIILRSILKLAISLLDLLDELIGKCAEESGGVIADENGNLINYSSIPQTELDADLLASLEEQEADGTPGPPYLINGFILEVQTDRNNPVGSLKRRFAVAKNKQGVIMLEGEKSFSANEQILINELKFYIQQNDLKAF